MESRCLAWFSHKRLIWLACALDHGLCEPFLSDLEELLILFGLDYMGIHGLKIRVDLAFSRVGGSLIWVDWSLCTPKTDALPEGESAWQAAQNQTCPGAR
jgi:hypothetical protein